MQAISSPWGEWIAELETRHVNSENGLAHVLEWDTKRGRDFQCLAQLVYCCDLLPDHALPTAQKLEKWLARVDNPNHNFKTHINDVLTVFWHIATSPELNAGFVQVEKRVAPVEFVFIGESALLSQSTRALYLLGTLLFILRDLSYQERANAILHMRLRIREQFRDVRNNGVVGKALWNYIDSITGPNGLKVLEAHKSFSSYVLVPGSTRKRKAPEDDDYHPTPVKTLGQGTKTRARIKQSED